MSIQIPVWCVLVLMPSCNRNWSRIYPIMPTIERVEEDKALDLIRIGLHAKLLIMMSHWTSGHNSTMCKGIAKSISLEREKTEYKAWIFSFHTGRKIQCHCSLSTLSLQGGGRMTSQLKNSTLRQSVGLFFCCWELGACTSLTSTIPGALFHSFCKEL